MHQHDPLLHDVLNESGGSGSLESGSLDAMLSAARRVRIRRECATGSGAITAAVALAAAVFFSQRPVGQPSTSAGSPAVRMETATVHKLTDEELFALFPGRQMALVGPPEDQRLFFLDASEP